MVVMVELDQVQSDEAAQARSLLAVHRAERDVGGFCLGCLEFACRLAWWPCPQARWAQALLASAEGGRS